MGNQVKQQLLSKKLGISKDRGLYAVTNQDFWRLLVKIQPKFQFNDCKTVVQIKLFVRCAGRLLEHCRFLKKFTSRWLLRFAAKPRRYYIRHALFAPSRAIR